MADQRPGLTPYNYVQNNPIMRIDPTGMLDTIPGAFTGNRQPASSESTGNLLTDTKNAFTNTFKRIGWLGEEIKEGINQKVVDGAITEFENGNYTQAALGIVLSRAKILPNVANKKLKNIVDDLFRDIPDHKKNW